MPKKKIVTIHEAKTNLSKLISEALQGVEITIARGKKPVVKLEVILEERNSKAKQSLGKWDKKVSVPDDFNHPISDLDDYQ